MLVLLMRGLLGLLTPVCFRDGERFTIVSSQRCYSTVSSSHYESLNVIDTAACTLVSQPCPPNPRYRNIDGTCSNDKFPHWGSSNISYARLLPAWYEDGKYEPRRSVTGEELPNARLLSVNFFPDKELPDNLNTINLLMLGQLIVHDCGKLDSHHGEPDNACCTSTGQLPDPSTMPEKCRYPIKVAPDDYFYSQFNVTCIQFVRARWTESGTCYKYPVQQRNFYTGVIDASFIYGSDEGSARTLRSFVGGKLAVQTTEDGRHFPIQAANPQSPMQCFNPKNETTCYFFGDDRVNINTAATVYMICSLRLHNHLCDELALINPHWDDETLYQTVRRIMDGFLQKLIYKDLLPVVLGKDYMRRKGLLMDVRPDSCVNFYNPDINPSMIHEFSTAAFRSLHSIVPSGLTFASETYDSESYLLLKDYYSRQTVTTEPGRVDGALRGMCRQQQKNRDRFVTDGLTNFLFKRPNAHFGTDLEATTIQRCRDSGFPSYNQVRVLCGLKRAKTFEDFEDVIPTELVKKLKKFYRHVDDVDLYVGGQCESLVEGTLLGPTFLRISGEQFYNLMRGDRFYYENCGQPWSFTKEQLNEIYKLTVSWLFCMGGNDISRVPKDALRTISARNPIVPCSEIHHLNLKHWKER